jgi:hypothetical protein
MSQRPDGRSDPSESSTAVDPASLAEIAGLIRCEEFTREALGEQITELTHTVYPHEQVYGSFVTVQAHIDCPPEKVFAYMANAYSLLEWTYSVRNLHPSNTPDVLVGVDAGGTPIYVKTIACKAALTVDYHCAWDQGDELWMVYLNRIVSAETVLKRPGSVVLWTNCRHPYYQKNPFPELSDPKREWVGDWWPLFYAGHTIELENLKRIVEHRHARGLPMGPTLLPRAP